MLGYIQPPLVRGYASSLFVYLTIETRGDFSRGKSKFISAPTFGDCINNSQEAQIALVMKVRKKQSRVVVCLEEIISPNGQRFAFGVTRLVMVIER